MNGPVEGGVSHESSMEFLFKHLSSNETGSGLPADYKDIPELKLYDVNGEGADDWEKMLFHEDGNQNEAWLITRLHLIGQRRYRRTTSRGCSWHSHTKPDNFTSFMRNRFTLQEKHRARSNNNSMVFKYTMLEYTTCKDEYALCKIVRREANAPITAWQGSHSKKRRISTKSSQQSTKIAVGPSEFHATMGHVNSTIMGLTDHECGNNKNLYKEESSRSHADEFMQEGGNQNQEDKTVYELEGIIMTKLIELIRRHPQAARRVVSFIMGQLAETEINTSLENPQACIKKINVSQENVSNETVYGSVAQPMNNLNGNLCSGVAIKESDGTCQKGWSSKDKGPVQNNYGSTSSSPWNDGNGTKIISEANGLMNSQHGLQTPSPVENGLTDFSPAGITDTYGALPNDFPNSSFPHEGIIPLNPLENASNISDSDMCQHAIGRFFWSF